MSGGGGFANRLHLTAPPLNILHNPFIVYHTIMRSAKLFCQWRSVRLWRCVRVCVRALLFFCFFSFCEQLAQTESQHLCQGEHKWNKSVHSTWGHPATVGLF